MEVSRETRAGRTVPSPVDTLEVVPQHPVRHRFALRQVCIDVVEDELAPRVDGGDDERLESATRQFAG